MPTSRGQFTPGADPGALLRSGDWGETWEEVPSLTNHPTRAQWNPGAGGMCLHSIQCLGQGRMVVAISAAGAFRTSDGGATWLPHNGGVRAPFLPNKLPEVGQCVHQLLAHPNNPEELYQQNHCGIYRGQLNGDRWTDISRGLPSRFGFGLVSRARGRTSDHVHGADRFGRVSLQSVGKVSRGADPRRRRDVEAAIARAASAERSSVGFARGHDFRPS